MGVLDEAIREHLELKRRRGADAGEVARLESEALGPVRRSAAGVPDMSDVPAAPPPADSEGAPLEGATPAHPTSASEPTPAYEPAPAYEPPEPPPASSFSSAPLKPRPAPYESSSPPPASHEPPVPARSSYEAPPSPPLPGDEPPPTSILRPPPITSEHATVDPYEPLHQPEQEPPAPTPADEPSTSLLGRFSPGRRLRLRRQAEPEEELTVGFKPSQARDEPPSARDEPPPYAAPAPADDDAAVPTPHESDIVPADDEPGVEDLLEETPEFLEETPEHDRLWFEQRPPRDFDFDG